MYAFANFATDYSPSARTLLSGLSLCCCGACIARFVWPAAAIDQVASPFEVGRCASINGLWDGAIRSKIVHQPHNTGLSMKHQARVQAIGIIWGFLLLGSLAGCAQLNDTGLALLSSNLPAVAIVDGQLLQGEIQLFPDHTGTVSLRGQGSCMGRLRYTATSTGAVDLRCSGGVVCDLKMTLLGDTRGYGYGPTASGTASLVFGMTAQESVAHLIVPADRRLVERAGTAYLELQ